MLLLLSVVAAAVADRFRSFRFVPISIVVFDCTCFVWPHRVQLLLLLWLLMSVVVVVVVVHVVVVVVSVVVVVVVHVDVKNDMQQLTVC